MCIAKRVEFKPNDNPFETWVDPLQNYFLYIDMNLSQQFGQQSYIVARWLFHRNNCLKLQYSKPNTSMLHISPKYSLIYIYIYITSESS